MSRRDPASSHPVYRAEAYNIISNTSELISAARRHDETVAQTRLYFRKRAAAFGPYPPRPVVKDAKAGNKVPAWMTARPNAEDDPRLRAEARLKEREKEEEERRSTEFVEMLSSGDGMGVGVKIEDAEHDTIQKEMEYLDYGKKRQEEEEGDAEPSIEVDQMEMDEEEDGGVRVDAGPTSNKASSVAGSSSGDSPVASRRKGGNAREKRKRSERHT